MDINQRKAAFVQLGNFLGHFSEKKAWPGYPSGINEAEFIEFNEVIEDARKYNAWFIEENVRKALHEWSLALTEKNLNTWIEKYPKIHEKKNSKTVAIIMAGNIPLVGFHDLLVVLLSGNSALIKLSSDDNQLLPNILRFFVKNIEPEFDSQIKFSTGKLIEFDAIIATGSDNSSRYFDYYFNKYPHIIRKNRSSIAILDGTESKEDLIQLGHDIFDYFGLGCRNVSKVYIPLDFDLNRIFEALYGFREIVNHNKYGNNYDYNKAVYLLNKIELLENGFILFKEDEGLHSPLAVLFYERYKDLDDVLKKTKEKSDEIQCIVGTKFIPFGKSQSPQLWDYADNIDTFQFLSNL